jgi:hypothetical protein
MPGACRLTFYNYAARLIVERISWLVSNASGAAKLIFERVRGYPEGVLIDYLALLRSRSSSDPSIRVDWGAIHPKVRVDSPANLRGLSAADIAAGALDSAMRSDPHTGLLEPVYLETLAPVVMKFGTPARHLRFGLKALAPDDTPFTDLAWWPGPFIA